MPSATEDKWYQHWLEKGYFNSQPDDTQIIHRCNSSTQCNRRAAHGPYTE